MNIWLDTPSFFLYGEPPREVERHFLHVEPLDDRSRPSEWSIQPHAHARMHHIFLIASGCGTMFVDSLSRQFEAPCVLLVPAEVVHSFNFERESAGWVMTIADTLFADLVLREPLFSDVFRGSDVVEVAAEGDVIAMAVQQTQRELLWPSAMRAPIIDGALLIAAGAILRARGSAVCSAPGVSRTCLRLVARFREAADRDWNRHLPVSAYAKMLGTSPSRLRAACVAVTGEGPLAMLQRRVMLEAQRALIYSSLSVTEVAIAAGFDDPAYFSRAFRSTFGCSPRVFRAAGTGM